MGRKLLVSIVSIIALVLCLFGSPGEAQAKSRVRSHTRGPRFAPLVVTNGVASDAPRSLEITVTPLTRRGRMPRRTRSFTMTNDFAGGGALNFQRLRWNHFYGIEIKDSMTGEVLVNEAIPVFRTYPVKQFKLPGTPDPRIAQIAGLQQQVTLLQLQVAALQEALGVSGQTNEALQSQIAALNETIAALQAQISALQAQIENGTPSSSIGLTTNSAFASPIHTVGTAGQRVASYLVTIPVGRVVSLSRLTARLNPHSGFDMQNMRVKVASAEFGSPVAVVPSGTGNFTFSSSMTSSAGSFVIDVYVDILLTSTPATYSSLIDLTDWSATDESGKAIAFPGTVVGQNVTLTTGGILTVSDWSSLLTKWVLPGSTGNRLSSRRVTASGDDVKIPQVVWNEENLGGNHCFTAFYLYDGPTKIAGPVAMSGNSVTFALTDFVVRVNTTRELVLVADAASYSSGGFTSGGLYIFGAAPSDITAVSVSTGTPAVVTGTLWQVYRVYAARSVFTIGYGVNTGSPRARTSTDRPFLLDLAADSAGSVQVIYLKGLFTNAAVPSSISAFTVDEIDPLTGIALVGTSQVTASWDSSLGGWVVELRFSYTIEAGKYKRVYLQVNSSGFADSPGYQQLDFQIIDQTWNDGDASFTVTPSSPVTLQTLYE